MDKRDFFIAALKAGRHIELKWVVTAFTVSRPEKPTGQIKPFEIYSDDSGHYHVTPENEYVRFEGADPRVPLYSMDERLDVAGDDCPNLVEPTNTRYGNLLFNWRVLVWAFGSRFPYQNGAVSARKLEETIAAKLVDDPKDPEAARDERVFYVSEYLRFTDAMFDLTGFSQICVWAATRKTLLPPPGIKQLRDKLIAENKDRINELAVIAKINKELLAYDAAWLKGDPGGERFTTPGKPRDIVRAKKFLMHGAEQGMEGNGVNATLVPNSLYDGWDEKYFPVMNDSLRSGSFNRGAETMLGGVEVKALYRATSNCTISQDDCGSTLGSVETLSKDNVFRFMGMTIIDDGKQIKLETDDVAGQYLGKTIMVRNPMYCKLDYTDYCKTCVGDRLAVNPYGLAAATSDYGSTFLNLFMKAMHGKTLKTARMDISSSIL